jgi:hypothetical protein
MIELALAAALMAQDMPDAGAAHETGLPRCDQLESNDRHEDCALQPGDGRELKAAFTFTGGEWAEDGRMEVSAFEGHLLQAFDFQTESFFYPSLDDINADGFEDILIPLITGNVNTEYAVFMGHEHGFVYQPWQVNGFAVEAATQDGLIVARSRSSAAESYAEFYRFDGEQITGEAVVLLSFMNVENVDDGPDCSLVNGGEDMGEAYYCGLAMDNQ